MTINRILNFTIKNIFYYNLSNTRRYIYSVTKELPTSKLFKDGKDGTPSVSKQIEEVWKKRFKEIENSNKNNKRLTDFEKEKKYILAMFPYPSGHLHMGHVRVYTISDILAKYYRMNGYQVLHPIGWDAFGLPAENAAIERNVSADSWTYSNISSMKEQLSTFGCNFDWENELCTCSPEYYKWTQKIFLQLFQDGLAYQQEALVNWDPVDKTVLANEQVDSKGRSWRSGVQIEKKCLRQWFIQITKYNDDLAENLQDANLENWETVGKIQLNWIGKSEGFRVIFDVQSNGSILKYSQLHGWIKNPENIPNINFIGINKDNPLYQIGSVIQQFEDYYLLNINAINPITNQNIPILVSDNFKFPKVSKTQQATHYISTIENLENDEHILKKFNISLAKNNTPKEHITDLFKNKNEHNTIDGQYILETLKKNKRGGYPCSLFAKDWLVSRQRYWGTPIPIIHCDSCGVVPVPEKDLPVELPQLSKISSTSRISSLQDVHDWVNCSCPKCGQAAKRETDTLDTFVDSCWYFLRFIDPHNKNSSFSKQIADYMMPVDVYVGGIEHAVMHLYYSRFLQRYLYNCDLISHKEPFKRLLMVGQVKGPTFKLKDSERYLRPDQVQKIKKTYVEKATGAPVIHTIEKMGKSKHNGVNPLDIIEEFGVDSTRLMIVSCIHPYDALAWNTSAHYRSFQMRLYGLVIEFFKKRNGMDPLKDNEYVNDIEIQKHKNNLVEKRNYFIHIIKHHFENTQNISAVLENLVLLTRLLGAETPKCVILEDEFEYCLRDLLIMLNPVIPYLSSELWTLFISQEKTIGANKNNLHEQQWPKVDIGYVYEEENEINDHL